MMMTSYNSTETFMKSDKPSEIAVAATNHIYTGKKEGRTDLLGKLSVLCCLLITLSKFRTLSEIIVCLLLIVFFFLHNDIIGFLHPLFECDVYGLLFQCVVPNTKLVEILSVTPPSLTISFIRFFFVVHFLSLVALVGYLICSAYNFIWILHPR